MFSDRDKDVFKLKIMIYHRVLHNRCQPGQIMIKTRGWYEKASKIVKLKKTITKTSTSQFQEVGLIRISRSQPYDAKQRSYVIL